MKISSILPLFAVIAAGVKAQLQTGCYLIRSQPAVGGGFVGRNPYEDRSLLPKPVVILDDDNTEPASNKEKIPCHS